LLRDTYITCLVLTISWKTFLLETGTELSHTRPIKNWHYWHQTLRHEKFLLYSSGL
jgi:hypothetical protein